MKTTNKKEFDAVKFMRQARDKISKDIADMDYLQIKEYCRKKQEGHSLVKPLA